MKLRHLIISTLLSVISVFPSVANRTLDLRVEQMSNPLGLDTDTPRFSWEIDMTQRNVTQISYRILVSSSKDNLDKGIADLWDSGTVKTEDSHWISYKGVALQPNQRCFWKVNVVTDKGDLGWSELAEWGMGLFTDGDWKAQWIGLDRPMEWDSETQWSRLSARYLRKEFDLNKKVIRATAHICGLGLYELHINGEKVGDQVLAPAPTDYRKSQLYNSFDVTSLLKSEGANALGVILGNGRYHTMRQNYKPYKIANFGYPKMRMHLIVEYADGTKESIVSNGTWRLNADGPIRTNNEYDGEEYDARKEFKGWSNPGFDDADWMVAERVSLPIGSLRAQMTPGMKVVNTLSPISIQKLPNDTYIFDMGQNMVGWIRMKVKGNLGDKVQLRFAETLQANGALYMENLRDARVTDIYTLKGEGIEEWAPRFVYHGFRYVEVTGFPSEPTLQDFIGEVVSDEMENIGHIETSNTVLNQVLKNAYWGILGNYKGMPVDCPQRNERQPWLGDRAAGTLGESYFFDNGLLYAKWMHDIVESQRFDGSIPDVSPAYWNYYSDNMTWPAALFLNCEMIYNQFGNIEPVLLHYPAMKRWLEYMQNQYMTADYIMTRDRYGDWCVPPESLELIHSKDSARITNGELIGTAYLYKLLTMMGDFARLQNLDAESKMFDLQAKKVKLAFNNRFWNADKKCFDNNTVTANLLPLVFGIVESANVDVVSKNIVSGLNGYDKTEITTGMIGTQWLMRELAKMGRADVAFVLASNDKYPSWGYMAAQGATTIWELWNGNTASPKMNSGNHVMLLGDLIPYCFEHLAGIKSKEAGFKRIVMKPEFKIEELSFINSSYKTPYGKVISNWKQNGNAVSWHIQIPANSKAEIWLPTEKINAISESGKGLKQLKDVKVLRRENGHTICEIGSGSYHFDILKDHAWGYCRKGIVADEFLFEKASFPESHGATIAETPSGIVAAWFAGTKEANPDCSIRFSRRMATGWSEPIVVADGMQGDTLKQACWNPVLYQIPDGDLLLFYKVGKRVAFWEGWLIRSKDGGESWSKPERLPDGFLGPIKNRPEMVDGRIICPSSTEGNGWKIHFEISDDMGYTWRKVGPIEASEALPTFDPKANNGSFDAEGGGDLPDAPKQVIQAIQPSLLLHKDGRLQVLCRTRNGAVATAWSKDKGETWSALELTMLPNNNSGTDAVTLQDGRHVIVYNHYRTRLGTKKGMRNPLNVAVSKDGLNWQGALVLESSPISQYSYPSVIQSHDGMLHFIYTWRRKRIKYVQVDPKQMNVSSFDKLGWIE